ncbi:unnamed protein product [Paramecium sonneborni]|uniref:Metalloenzyme domain-containing protein n=1 Tax=Paramecium sonneborni TaxID=65129 RepID=A0A8S1N407_9CILI|nr:unnamed protein product [Paramecium sonneborni]
MKILFVIIDGVADVGTPETQFKTPLQLAEIPTLNQIASTGLAGLMDPVEPGLSCGSDTAHMSIFGYDPFTQYRGRGAFETMGSGIDMQVGDIAFKCNFAYMHNGIVKLRRVDREFPEWGLPLIDALNTQLQTPIQIQANHATEHRIGLKVVSNHYSGELTDEIIGTDPLKDNLPLRQAKPKVQSDKAIRTANIINQLSDSIHQMLSQHPINLQRQSQGLPTANVVLLRGCGQRIQVQNFQEKYGLKGAVIAPTAIIQGLGKTIGLEWHHVEGATGDYNSNFINKGKKAIELLQNQYDFVFLHIKAVDDAGHDKSKDLKIKYIQKVDQMMHYIVTNIQLQDLVIAVTGDHTTPYAYVDHTFQSVPFIISKLSLLNGQKNDIQFNEISCLKGALGRFCGKQVMQIIKQYSS